MSSQQQKQRQDIVCCDCDMCNGAMIPRSTRRDHGFIQRRKEFASYRSQAMSEIFKRSLGIGLQQEQDSVSPLPKSSPQPPKSSSNASSSDRIDRETYDTISKQLKQLYKRIKAAGDSVFVLQTTPFIFTIAPQEKGETAEGIDLGLDPRQGCNIKALQFEIELDYLCQELTSLKTSNTKLEEARNDLVSRLETLQCNWDDAKLSAWRRAAASSKPGKWSGHVVVTDSYYVARKGAEYAAHLVCTFLVVVIHVLFNCSRDQCDFILAALDLVIDTVHRFPGTPTSTPLKRHIPPIPKTLDAALAKFNISPVVQPFAQCPSDGSLYPITDGSFAEFCSHRGLDGKTCGRALGSRVRIGNQWINRPLKTFEYQSPINWLGRLLSRPGLEVMMDDISRKSKIKRNATDIWEARGIHEAKWKDGLTFRTAPREQLRLVFTVGIDWFRVYHTGQSKKTWSIGAIYLVCLNLPPSLRYRLENVCLVGIIPGPKKPSADEMNNLLTPLIDDFAELWDKGVWYSRTTEFPEGRLVLALLLLLVCDLDACRALAGFTSHAHTFFCSYCYLTLGEIDNHDPESWPERSCKIHRQHAALWKHASTQQERDAITKEHGVRWAKILDLPYFDPVRHVALCVAHNMLLGNAKRHCRTNLKMDVTVAGGDGSNVILTKVPSAEELANGNSVLQTGKTLEGVTTNLRKLYLHVLYALAVEHGILSNVKGRPNVKAHLVDALEQHVCLPSPIPELTGTNQQRVQRTLKRWPEHTSKPVKNRIPPPQQATPTTNKVPIQMSDDPLDQHDRHRWQERFRHPELLEMCKQRWTEADAGLINLNQKQTKAKLAEYLRLKEPHLGIKSKAAHTSRRDPPSAEGLTKDLITKYEDMLYRKQRHNWYTVKKEILYHLCRVHQQPQDPNPQALWNMNTTQLADILHVRLRPDRPKPQKAKVSDSTKSAIRSSRTVLGANVLDEIRKDRAKMILPTGIRKAPEHMGSAGHGKLSADEWRSACTIHMPVTLVRLWGLQAEDSRFFRILDNFIHLIIAIYLSVARETSPEHRQKFISHMILYLEEFRNLFPQESSTPNQHLSLHLPDLFCDFGPVHPWWTMPFERFNGLLQRITTNFRFSHIETTMMKRFCQAANLRGLIADRALPDPLTQIYPSIDPLIKGMYRGTLDVQPDDNYCGTEWIASVMPKAKTSDSPSFSGLELQLIRSHLGEEVALNAIELSSAFARGFVYRAAGPDSRLQDFRDSSITFKDASGQLSTGRIRKLISSKALSSSGSMDGIYAIVQRFKPLNHSDALYDPYRKWPDLPCMMVYDRLEDQYELVPQADISGHVGICPYEDARGSFSAPTIVLILLGR
ncbi:hypothetical protein FRB99_004148 [Tulasnella sp. 403]|nr:hypothetical protein FRB99_004148 [Tulasnella sp. 403]